MLAALVSLLPVASRAAANEPAPQIVDLPGEHRLVVLLGPVESGERVESGAGAVVTAGGRISHAAMLHRFRIEVVDSAGRVVRVGGAWNVTLFADAATDGDRPRLDAMVQLSAHARDVSVPRPLGYRLRAADSLLIVATFHEPDSRGPMSLRMIIEYDPFDAPASRLAVLPMQSSEPAVLDETDALAHENAPGRVWEWRPAVSGRMLAIVGLPLAIAGELVLEDAQSGEVLWRATLTARDATDGFARTCEVVRLGVAVEAGRVYRLRATLVAGLPAAAGRSEGAVLAMVLPTRSAAR